MRHPSRPRALSAECDRHDTVPAAGSGRTNASCARRLGISADAIVCLFVGRLSREKGLMDLMEAWRQRVADTRSCWSPAPTWTVMRGTSGRRRGSSWCVTGSSRPCAFSGSIADVAPLLRAADICRAAVAFRGARIVRDRGAGVRRAGDRVGGRRPARFRGRRRKRQAVSTRRPRRAGSGASRRWSAMQRCGARLAASARASVLADYDERARVRAVRHAASTRSPRRARDRRDAQTPIPVPVEQRLRDRHRRQRPAPARAADHRRTLLSAPTTTDASRSRSRSRLIVETIMDIGLGPVTVRAVARDKAGAGQLLRARARAEAGVGRDRARAARRRGARCCDRTVRRSTCAT